MVDRAPCPEKEPDAYVEYVSRFGVPAAPQVAAAAGLARKWFKPRFIGADNLPARPALLIGNHAFMAIDAALFHLYLYYDHGRYVKGLGDKTLFANPYYAALAHAMGGVSGRAPVVQRLMARGDDLLLYPGGAYEAIKPPESRYQLQWKQRYGFVRLAAEAGYDVVPVASVGPDEYYDHAISSERLFNSSLVRLMMKAGMLPADLRADLVPPIPTGMLGGPLPKPKTTYFAIGKPISLDEYRGEKLTTQKLTALRRKFAKAIDAEIKALLLLRERERHRDGWLRRVLSA
ncbi:MAG: lysophospholipid acyltransferase family protein [Luminiphilus sp.]|nr:lysophospholipid acyltransferase family protein [Luminiphilus sp.]